MANMKVHVLGHGRQQFVPKYMMFGGEKNERDLTSIPSYTVLVEHPDGLLLYDASTNLADFIVHRLWRSTGFWVEEPGECLMVRLQQLGYHPGDIEKVVISHMHPDHVGWLHVFTNAEIMVPETDFLDRAKKYLLGTDPFAQEVEFWSKCKINWKLIREYETKIFEGVTIYNYGPGHAGGMLTMLLNLPNSGNKLVVSDAIYAKRNIQNSGQGFPGYAPYDTEGYVATMEDILRMSSEKNAELWFGHDMEQYDDMKKAPDAYYD